ncbi:hypothetical protein ACCQ08_03090 [Comamonas sp. SY3]|uniref:hypothetical protein n=1 Tax=Comamonas sp. SY3 TaxID=3243601 RepID=UPI0035947EAA
MSAINVTLRDAPTKMSSEGVAAAEQKFSTILAKQFSSQESMSKAYKAYQTAQDGDVPLSTQAQSQAMAFHNAVTKATQLALGGYRPTEDTRFDVRLN